MKQLGLLLALALATTLSACKGDSWAPEDPKPADQLTVGKVQSQITVGMDAASVAQILGSPNIVTTDEQRREVWIYDKVSTDRVDHEHSVAGTILIIGGHTSTGKSSTTQRTLTIIIKYDEAKKVRDFAYNYSQF